jgi:dihydroflavonol-4-reductase
MDHSIVAVTGISGLVGGNLVRALLSRGARVRGLIHHDTRAIQGLAVECIPGDVLDTNSLRQAFTGADVVYHCAAHISLQTGDREHINAVNITGTRNVVNACRECDVRRLVHLSSIHALDQQAASTTIDETTPLALSPDHLPYDRSKAAGELEVRRAIAAGLDAVILNPTGIIGPYDFKPSFFGRAVLALAKGKMPALVKGGFDWIDVRDVVAGMLQAESHAPPGSSYILSGSWRSIRAVADQVAAWAGVPAPRFAAPLWAAYLGIPLMNLIAKIQKTAPLYTRVSLDALRLNRPVSSALAERELNHSPRSFETTISDSLDWFAQNGYLSREVM